MLIVYSKYCRNKEENNELEDFKRLFVCRFSLFFISWVCGRRQTETVDLNAMSFDEIAEKEKKMEK